MPSGLLERAEPRVQVGRPPDDTAGSDPHRRREPTDVCVAIQRRPREADEGEDVLESEQFLAIDQWCWIVRRRRVDRNRRLSVSMTMCMRKRRLCHCGSRVIWDATYAAAAIHWALDDCETTRDSAERA